MKENEVGGFNPRAKMGSWFIPWPSLGVLNGIPHWDEQQIVVTKRPLAWGYWYSSGER